MSLEEMELNVGGTSFKGIWIAVIVSFSSTLGGGIWAASEFFSRLEALEENVVESTNSTEVLQGRFDDLRTSWADDKKQMSGDIKVVQTKVEDANIDELQGKLASLGTNLNTIMDQQRQLLQIQDRIIEVEQKVTEMEVIVQKAESVTSGTEALTQKLDRVQKEIEDLWSGLDYLSNPYGS